MGHFLFIVLHFVALIWFAPALFLTIALHIIYTTLTARANAAAARAMKEQPSADTHVRCPECQELVRKEARKCKHCGTALVPQ